MRRSLVLKVMLPLSAVTIGWAGMAATGPAAAARNSVGTSHRGLLPPRDPAASLSPAPSFLTSC